MAGDTIGKLSTKITADTTEFSKGVQKTKDEVKGLTSQTSTGPLGGFDIKSLLGGGMSGILGKIAIPAGVTVAAKQLHSQLVAMGAAAKELSIAAAGAGVSMGWMQKMSIYAEKAGVTIDMISGALSKVRKEMGASLFGSLDKQGALKELKIDASVLRLPKEQAYDLIIDRLLKVSDSFKRAQIGMALFEETWFKVEAALTARARGEKISLVSEESLQAAKEFGDWWKEYSRSWSVWWQEMLGNAAKLTGMMRSNDGKDFWGNRKRGGETVWLGFGGGESARLAAANKEAREFERKVNAERQEQWGRENAAADAEKKLMREWLMDMHGLTAEQKEIERIRQAYAVAGMTLDDRQLQSLVAQKKAAKELAELRDQVKQRVESTLTAEQKFVRETMQARAAWQKGLLTTSELAQLDKQSRKDLGAAWKSEMPQLPELALKGSQEAYKAIVGSQALEAEHRRRIMEVNRLLLQAMQATERNTRGIGAQPPTAHLN